MGRRGQGLSNLRVIQKLARMAANSPGSEYNNMTNLISMSHLLYPLLLSIPKTRKTTKFHSSLGTAKIMVSRMRLSTKNVFLALLLFWILRTGTVSMEWTLLLPMSFVECHPESNGYYLVVLYAKLSLDALGGAVPYLVEQGVECLSRKFALLPL